MTDPRITNLARIIAHHSTRVQAGDKVLIRGFPLEPIAAPLITEIFREVLRVGGHPHYFVNIENITYHFINEASEAQLLEPNMFIEFAAEKIDVDIRLTAESNRLALSNVDSQRRSMLTQAYAKTWKVLFRRAASKELRWVATRYPCNSMAQSAEMSLPEYEDFFYKAAFADEADGIEKWEAVKTEQDKLVDWFRGKKHVKILGEDIELEMSIADRPFINCFGDDNMPDGEIFTGPVEASVQGRVRFSYPSVNRGIEVGGIELIFEDGKVVHASAEKNQDHLLTMLDIDVGARFLGELGIGTNYRIDRFTGNMLLDEKIGGTIHLALGHGYPESGSQNKSAIHWDLLTDMWQGGQIIVDGEIIYESGRFLI